MCVCSFEQITATSKEAVARFVSKFWILLHSRWLILFCACTMVSMPKQDVPMQTLLTFVCNATCRRNGRFLTTGESKRHMQICFKAFLHFFLFFLFFLQTSCLTVQKYVNKQERNWMLISRF